MSTMVHLDQWAATKAPLTEAEKASVDMLSDWVSSLSSAGVSDETAEISSDVVNSEDMSKPTLPTAPLVDAPAYLSWYTKQQSFVNNVDDPIHLEAIESLRSAGDKAEALLDHLDAARVHISELRAGAKFVEEGSEGLREEAESMVERIDHLAELSQGLSLRLSYFSILPASTSFLSSPSLSLVTSDEFLLTMDRLDVALAFIDAHPHYRDSPLYKMRFEHCVLRAGTLIRMYALARWKELSQEALFKLRTWEKDRASSTKEKEGHFEGSTLMYLGEAPVSALVWDRYEEESTSMRPLLVELEKRASLLAAPASTNIQESELKDEEPINEKAMLADYYEERPENELSTGIFRSPEFVSLLSECRQAYFEARKSLLGSIIANCLAQLEVSTQHRVGESEGSNHSETSAPIIAFITKALSFLSAVCERELILCRKFYLISAEVNSESYREFSAYIFSLCNILDEKVRSRISRETSISSLSSICLALIGGEELEKKSSDLIYSTIAIGTLKQAQERLLSRARALISGSTMSQFETREEDVDYPAKIRKSHNQHRRAQSSIGGAGLLEAAAITTKSENDNLTSSPSKGFKQMDEHSATSSIRLFTSPAASIVSSWYPPLATTLSLLSATNDALPAHLFLDLAYSAVDICRISIDKAGEYMSSQGGLGAGRIGLSGRMDVPLFRLRHLYLLREILASIGLRKASSSASIVDRRLAATSNSQAGSTSATIVDFAKLVETINALWAGLRGYKAETTSTKEDRVETLEPTVHQSSILMEADIAKASKTFVEVVYHGVVLPLRVNMDQLSRRTSGGGRRSISGGLLSPPIISPTTELKSPPLSSVPSTPLSKVRSSVKAFQTCAQTNLREANEAMRLYLDDDRAIKSLSEEITKNIIDNYAAYLNSLETSSISLEDVPELKEIGMEEDMLLSLLCA